MPKLSEVSIRPDFNDEWVGREFAYAGKQCVVDAAAGKEGVVFSKMGGVLRWANGVMLWVNLDGGAYENPFKKHKGKYRFTFYGSPAMTTSSVYHTALTHSDPDYAIYLLARPTATMPYILYGRARYLSHDDTEPVEYSLELVDTDSIAEIVGYLVERPNKRKRID